MGELACVFAEDRTAMTRLPAMSVAHDARAIANELIPEHHPHLLIANILYVFTDQRRKRCDRVRIGSSQKLSSTERFLASGLDGVEQGPDFLILIDSVQWAELARPQRRALVDHELCHCALFVQIDEDADGVRIRPTWVRWTIDMDDPQDYGDRRWGMRGHDIEEFGEVLFRHGFWKPDGPEQKFGEIVAMQLRIPENGAIKSTAP